MFMRKLGLNPGTVAINLTQPFLNNYAQATPRTFGEVFNLAFDEDKRRVIYAAYDATGVKRDSIKFEGSEGMWTRLFRPAGLEHLRGASKGGAVGRILEKVEEVAGGAFRWSEQSNNFQAFFSTQSMARQGRVFRPGEGIVRSRPVTDPKTLNLMGLYGARRTQFGGRGTRAPIFQDPLLGLLFQFNTFNFRQTGLLGSQLKVAGRSLDRITKGWKEVETLERTGKADAAAKLKASLGADFTDNAMAPVRTILMGSAIAGLLYHGGVSGWDAGTRVFGFLPAIDTRALGEGNIQLIDGVQLGPAFGDIPRLYTALRNVAKADPSMQTLRGAELIATTFPVGEVVAKRLARFFFDPRLTESERYYLLAGFRARGATVFDDFTLSQIGLGGSTSERAPSRGVPAELSLDEPVVEQEAEQERRIPGM